MEKCLKHVEVLLENAERSGAAQRCLPSATGSASAAVEVGRTEILAGGAIEIWHPNQKAEDDPGADSSVVQLPVSDSVLEEILKEFSEREAAARRQREDWQRMNDPHEAALWKEEGLTWQTAILLIKKAKHRCHPAAGGKRRKLNGELSRAGANPKT